MLVNREKSKYLGIIDTDEVPMDMDVMAAVESAFESDENIGAWHNYRRRPGAVTMEDCLASVGEVRWPNALDEFDVEHSLNGNRMSANCRTQKMIIRPRMTDVIHTHSVTTFVNDSLGSTRIPEKLVHLRRKHIFVSYSPPVAHASGFAQHDRVDDVF